MREKTKHELLSRFQELVAASERAPYTPRNYHQYLTLLSYYTEYLNTNRYMRKALKKLRKDKKLVDDDRSLIKEADTIIEQMKTDRSKLVTAARRLKIDASKTQILPPDAYKSEADSFLLYLSQVNTYLNADEQPISELPRTLGTMRQMSWSLASLGSQSQSIKKIQEDYYKLQNDYDIKLRKHGLRKDFLRLDEYDLLEYTRRYIYGEMNQNEQLQFLIDHWDLVDEGFTKKYSDDEIERTSAKVSEHTLAAQRLHNYLSNYLAHVAWWLRLWNWLVEHFAPTVVSLILIYFIVWLLNTVFHFQISIKDVPGL